MREIAEVAEKLVKINEAYELSTNSIQELQRTMEDARVCIPVIGKFSSGKSALLNTILGYRNKILKENITPETAVPTEIIYSDSEDHVRILKRSGDEERLPIAEYRTYEPDISKIKSIRIELRSDALEKIPDIMLVDMPGFESGLEAHNQAIYDYLPKSLAYIFTIPADDMILRESSGNILKELCLYDMPFCVVITKYDKKTEEFEQSLEHLKTQMEKYIGKREVKFCFATALTGDAEEVERFLQEIQQNADDILAKNFSKYIFSEVENTGKYLNTILKNGQLSHSELTKEEEVLRRKTEVLKEKILSNKNKFDEEVRNCIEEIKDDVEDALDDNTSVFTTLALNNQSIAEQINRVVKTAVSDSIRKRYIPKVEKYMEVLQEILMPEDMNNIHVSFYTNIDAMNKNMAVSVASIVAGYFFGGPIGVVLMGLLMKKQRERKREELKQEIRRKLRLEVYPDVLEEIGTKISQMITEHKNRVNKSVGEELNAQKTVLEKAMSDLKKQIGDEKEKKKIREENIRSDLKQLEEIKDGLR